MLDGGGVIGYFFYGELVVYGVWLFYCVLGCVVFVGGCVIGMYGVVGVIGEFS